MDEPDNKRGSAFRGVGVAAALSAQLIVSVVLGFLLGRWLDGMFHTGPWLTIVGVLVGIVAGFVGLFQLSRVLSK
jgi:ATP synthase protein I